MNQFETSGQKFKLDKMVGWCYNMIRFNMIFRPSWEGRDLQNKACRLSLSQLFRNVLLTLPPWFYISAQIRFNITALCSNIGAPLKWEILSPHTFIHASWSIKLSLSQAHEFSDQCYILHNWIFTTISCRDFWLLIPKFDLNIFCI